MPDQDILTGRQQAEFLSHYHSQCAKSEERLRLRDQFAAAALTGLLASMQKNVLAEDLASHAYEAAEAMLAEREKI